MNEINKNLFSEGYCTCSTNYPYSQEETDEIFSELICAYPEMARIHDAETRRYKLFDANQEIGIDFLRWVMPYNAMANIGYILCSIHDESKPRSEKDSWEYYWISQLRVAALGIKPDFLLTRLTIDELAGIFKCFIDDSRQPQESRYFKTAGIGGPTAGRFTGGVVPVNADFVDYDSLRKNGIDVVKYAIGLE